MVRSEDWRVLDLMSVVGLSNLSDDLKREVLVFKEKVGEVLCSWLVVEVVAAEGSPLRFTMGVPTGRMENIGSDVADSSPQGFTIGVPTGKIENMGSDGVVETPTGRIENMGSEDAVMRLEEHADSFVDCERVGFIVVALVLLVVLPK